MKIFSIPFLIVATVLLVNSSHGQKIHYTHVKDQGGFKASIRVERGSVLWFGCYVGGEHRSSSFMKIDSDFPLSDIGFTMEAELEGLWQVVQPANRSRVAFKIGGKFLADELKEPYSINGETGGSCSFNANGNIRLPKGIQSYKMKFVPAHITTPYKTDEFVELGQWLVIDKSGVELNKISIGFLQSKSEEKAFSLLNFPETYSYSKYLGRPNRLNWVDIRELVKEMSSK